jgi:hypothetical protein
LAFCHQGLVTTTPCGIVSSILVHRPCRETATNRQLAELRCDLIGHSIQFPMAFSVRLIEQLLLRSSRVVELLDPESQQRMLPDVSYAQIS